MSDGGRLHTVQKAQLAAILESLVKIYDTKPEVETIIIDGSALNSLPPRSSKTFDDYASFEFLPKVQAYSAKYKRTDIVFDVYQQSSLKAETRSKRGHGARRKVTSNGKIPTNWRNFLRNDNNKTELFHFLADKVAQTLTPNVLIVTKEEQAVSNQSINLDEVSSCPHEEADTRIFVHAKHAVQNGSKNIMIKASDRRPCYSSQCFTSFSSSRSTTVMDCFWSRSEHEVDPCT